MSIEWRDEALVLSLRPLGEHQAVASLFTREHGRHAGLVHGVRSKKNRAVFITGTRLEIRWQARLDEQLGTFVDSAPLAEYAARVLDDAARLAGLASACALCDACLPERLPHPLSWEGLADLLASLPAPDWAVGYVRWELTLLAELGFGLDLSSCAATGCPDDLAFVSPKSGRAVSRAAGEDWKDKLLALPAFLTGNGTASGTEIAEGLTLSAYFLERHVLAPQRRPLPPARLRLAGLLARTDSPG